MFPMKSNPNTLVFKRVLSWTILNCVGVNGLRASATVEMDQVCLKFLWKEIKSSYFSDKITHAVEWMGNFPQLLVRNVFDKPRLLKTTAFAYFKRAKHFSVFVQTFLPLIRGVESAWAQCNCQRWSPRGRPWPRGLISKSLALASKVKSLALTSKPQVLENCHVFGRGLHYTLWKVKTLLENDRNLAENLLGLFFCFFGDRLKKIFEELFFVLFLENTCSCILDAWPWAGVPKPGGMGGYILQMFWLYPPPIIWVWSTSASPQIIWLWCASERRSPLEFEGKKCSIFGKDLFLVFA